MSNFGVPELQILLASAKVKPAANQVGHIACTDVGLQHSVC